MDLLVEQTCSLKTWSKNRFKKKLIFGANTIEQNHITLNIIITLVWAIFNF